MKQNNSLLAVKNWTKMKKITESKYLRGYAQGWSDAPRASLSIIFSQPCVVPHYHSLYKCSILQQIEHSYVKLMPNLKSLICKTVIINLHNYISK